MRATWRHLWLTPISSLAFALMYLEIFEGLKANLRDSKSIILICALAPLVLTTIADVDSVRQEFYVVLATTIPILLFALLVRHQTQRDLILKALDETEALEGEIAALRAKAHPDDASSLANLDELAAGRSQNKEELRNLAPRALAEIATSLFFTAIGMAGCLTALATGKSNYFTFYLPLLAMLLLGYAIASSEIGNYKVYFGVRGLLRSVQPSGAHEERTDNAGMKVV